MSNEQREKIGDWEIRFGDVPRRKRVWHRGPVEPPRWYAEGKPSDCSFYVLVWLEGNSLVVHDPEDYYPSGNYEIPLGVIEALRARALAQFEAYSATRWVGAASIQAATQELGSEIAQLKADALTAWSRQAGMSPEGWLRFWQVVAKAEPDRADLTKFKITVSAAARDISLDRTPARVPSGDL